MPTADELLSRRTVRDLADRLAATAHSGSPAAVRRSAADFDGVGLSDRVRRVRDALLVDLPEDYPAFAGVIGAALVQPDFTGWMIWPVTEALAVRALASGRTDDFDSGLALLAELTPRLTGEFAIRSFLDADPDRALSIVRGWTTHADAHVRRLASEGTRPRLPWARRVPGLLSRPGVTVPILDALYRDPSEYVRRSVANHLNDLGYGDPGTANATAARWAAAPDEHTAWVVRHGLRTLVKQGDPDALRLRGFGPLADVDVTGPVLGAPSVPFGGTLRFDVTVHNRGSAPAALAVDYVVHHRKANGTSTPKVFKLTTRTLAAGAATTISKSHSFRPISTRVYHPGEHALEIQVNGVRSGRRAFELEPTPGDGLP